MENKNRNKLNRAKKRVKELKGFYIHLTVYIAVNGFGTITKIMNNLQDGETINEAFWDFSTFASWFFWGIGLAFHAVKALGYNPFFSKDWEERQIQKYMEEDRKEVEKWEMRNKK